MAQVRRRAEVADVVVIGSGAGGGTAVKVLTGAGIDVTLIDAGPMVDPAAFKQHVAPWEVDHRGAGPNAEHYAGTEQWGYFNAPSGFWNDPAEPYTVAPGDKFLWFRSRIIGGRTNHFGRFTPRFSPYDFKPYSIDGLGVDWPIDYAEMSPYYDKAEAFIGVTGANGAGPAAPDGVFLPPPQPRVHEILVQRAGRKLAIPVVPARMAMLSKPINGRAACHYCGQCGRGCTTASAFSSSQAMIFPAMATGRLTIVTNAMVRELEVDGSGLVTGVVYIDKLTLAEHRIRCRVVVVAASACESARLLLNSKSPRFPDGLANGSGAVGRWLTDSTAYGFGAHIPALDDLPRHNCDGMGGGHLFIPWFEYDKKNKAFPRGYHIQMSGGFYMPTLGTISGMAWNLEGYGEQLKAGLRRRYGSEIWMEAFGEMIPSKDCYCEIDPDGAKDRYGIPILRFHWKWSDHELKQAGHMHETIKAFYEAMGGELYLPDRPEPNEQRISIGGQVIHEVGTIRMGDRAADSPLNRWCQAHEVKNLFVADGAPFPSNPEKNPTLSIVALAWRTSEYLAEEMRKGNI